MKINYLWLNLIGLLLLFSGCNKEELNIWDGHNGKVNADLNGNKMEDIFVSGFDVDTTRGLFGITINIAEYAIRLNNAELWREFAFVQIPKQIGLYHLSEKNSLGLPYGEHSTVVQGGHVHGDSYNLNLDFENQIEILSIDSDRNVTGLFQASFIRKNLDEPPSSSYALDTVTFTNGQFETKLADRWP